MNSSDIISGFVGLTSGEFLADSLVEEDNILGHVVVGATTGLATSIITKKILNEIEITDLLDDLF